MVEYLDDIKSFTVYHKKADWLWCNDTRLMETASGYGKKLTSDYVVLIDGEKKLRRVYITCFSNCGSAWIIYDCKQLFLRWLESSTYDIKEWNWKLLEPKKCLI